ncbi:hypothetical protein pb186bvf_020736, partial [Paramecium bursaria]
MEKFYINIVMVMKKLKFTSHDQLWMKNVYLTDRACQQQGKIQKEHLINIDFEGQMKQ